MFLVGSVLVTLVPGVTASGWKDALSGESTGPDCVCAWWEAPPLPWRQVVPQPAVISNRSLWQRPGPPCRRPDASAAWVPHPEKSAAPKRKPLHSQFRLKLSCAESNGMEWQGSAHTSRRPSAPCLSLLVLPTARLRFPGPSAPRTCTWAAPPPSGVCYLKPGADLRSGALECFISLLFIAGWVASEILFNFSGFRFPQLCDTQWPRRDISLLMKNGVFWMFSLYLEEYTGVGVELGSCSGRDPVTLGSQFIF